MFFNPVFLPHPPIKLVIDQTTFGTITGGSTVSDQLTCSNGVGTLTWSHTGSLPPGLSFSSSGLLSGTVNAPGSYSCVVTVKDQLGNTGTQAYSGSVTVTPGSSTYTSGFTFVAPVFNTLVVEGWGGGGGAGINSSGSGTGGTTSISSLGLTAHGGGAGEAAAVNRYDDGTSTSYPGASGGTASGGDVNTTGGAGGTYSSDDSTGTITGSIKGGSSPNGGAGGVNSTNWGSAPGGGGAADTSLGSSACGAGGYFKKTYTANSIPYGTSIPGSVGAAGTASTTNTSKGATGQAKFTWS